ncbi:MAG: putative exporter of the superfamily [Verrucomicrobiales bacterium]|nr:putative exporter of the superfamily [Verrucomicrobiales bacterium]
MAEHEQPSEKSIAARFLRWLAHCIYHYPRVFIYPQILLLLGCVLFTIGPARIVALVRGEKVPETGLLSGIQFDLNRDNLVGSDKKYHQNFLKFKQEFPAQDDLVVVIESDSTEKNRQFVERIGAKLDAETNLFTDVFYKGDLKMLGRKALLFVPENDLKDLKQKLHEFRPFIQEFTKATNLVSLFNLINTQFRTAKQEQNAENDSLVNALPALQRIIDGGTQALKRAGSPPSPGVNALFGAGEEAEQQIYITFNKGLIYLVTARAKNQDLGEQAVQRMRELVQETRAEVTGVNADVTGEPVLEVDEMVQSQKDSTIASIVSLLLCAGIFIYAYRETGRPLKATFCLIIGLGYTMAFTTLVIGHLNILTITFVPILIGLAIDFGVHLITRYEEETRRGTSTEMALQKAIVYTGMGIFTGALTTAGAFLAMGMTKFKGIQEMGIICGSGMMLCFIPMMTMLPALLLRGRQNVLDNKMKDIGATRARLEEFWLRRPGTLITITVIVCALAGTQFGKVYFDYNLLNMQSKGLASVEYEKKLINSTTATNSASGSDTNAPGKSILYAAIVATNLAQANQLETDLKKLTNEVATVESMTQYLSQDQEKKLEIVREIKKEISDFRFADIDWAPADIPELSATLWRSGGYLGLASDFAEKEDPKIAKQLLSLRGSINEFRKGMLVEDPAVRERLSKYQQALFDDIRDTFSALRQQDDSSPMTADDLPQALRNRFIGVTGKYLLQVYPKKDVWQRDYQEQFVTAVRKVDPNVTGTPVQLLEYTTLLKNSYVEAAWYALAAIAIMVFVHFRSLMCVVLALFPVAIGTIWMVGMMGAFDIPFNPANIMTLPLVIGIGVTNGIHILNRFAEEKTPGIFGKSTGKAVLVSGLNTIAGFGSLMLAKHQGIASLGFVMSVGVFTCMFAALTFLPAILKLLIRRGWSLAK